VVGQFEEVAGAALPQKSDWPSSASADEMKVAQRFSAGNQSGHSRESALADG